MSHNKLESLPDSVGYLPALASLNISFNPIRALPHSIYNKGDLDLNYQFCHPDLQREIEGTVNEGGGADLSIIQTNTNFTKMIDVEFNGTKYPTAITFPIQGLQNLELTFQDQFQLGLASD